MNRYYFKNTFLRLMHHKALSAVNIAGLTIGFTCCILIFLFVYDELQFDKEFPYKDRLYRVYGNNFGNGESWLANQPNKLYDRIMEEVPEIEKGTIFCNRELTISLNNSLTVEKFAYTDSSIFNITGWKLITGNPHEVLSQAMSVVISQSAAKRLFGTKNPVGEDILLNAETRLTISGIFKDISRHNHLYADFLTSKATRDSTSSGENHWGNFSSSILVRLAPNADPALVSSKITKVWMNDADKGQYKVPGKTLLKLQPIKDVYLHSSFISNFGNIRQGNFLILIGFSVIGLMILIIACFNYLNLTTAQANERGVEIGIRKTSGASKYQLYKQFLIESIIYTSISLILSITIIHAVLPWFNTFTAKSLTLSDTFPAVLYFIVCLVLLIIATAGLYPAFVMTKFETVSVLKGKLNVWGNQEKKVRIFHQSLSKTLVTAQFAISALLIICALFVNKQMSFVRNFDAGFDKTQIMVIESPWDNNQDQRYKAIKEFCAQMPEVEMVTAGHNVPTNGFNNYGSPAVSGAPFQKKSVGFITVDYDYLTCIGAHFVQGRNFDRSLFTDSATLIITESCAKQLDLKDPIGQTLDNLWDGQKRTIIGVVKDVYFTSLHRPVYPLLFMVHHQWMTSSLNILIKFKAKGYTNVRSKLETKWKELCTSKPFTYFFLEDKFEENYLKDNHTNFLMNIYTFLSILLCIMGLAGLAVFSVQKRTKEIGIRKVNGARVTEILAMLNKDFIKWVVIAFVIACPIAWYAMHKWLENFAYKTELSWWVFALAGIVAVAVAVITVSWQSWRAATRNPVESLRYE